MTAIVAALLLGTTARAAIGASPEQFVVRSVVEERYVTALVRLADLSPEQRALAFPRIEGEVCDCLVFAPKGDTVVITEIWSTIERILGRPIPVDP